MSSGATVNMTKRMICILAAISVGLFGWASANLVNIMLINSSYYQAKASAQQMLDTELAATRGDIYDRNMDVLATSAPAWTVFITPQDIEDDAQAEQIAKGLSELLGLDYDAVYKKTQSKSYYEKVKTKIDKLTADSVREYISTNKLGSVIGLDETSQRYYPNDNLASTVIGFVGSDNQGLSGIEAYYEKSLKGVAGRVIAAKNGIGADMPFSYEKVVDAQTGNSLVLTIDSYIQYVAEKYLEQAVAENNVTERGCCVIMNPATGEVLAMATKPDFNPNSPFTIYDPAAAEAIALLEGEERTTAVSAAQQKQWRNKCISDTYEPGSVFKIVTGSAAYEESVISLGSHFSCPGYITIANTRYNCHKHSGHGGESLLQAFQNSCNPAFISIGQSLGVNKFFKYFESFGFTEKTGIDLPGEASPTAGVSYHSGDTMSIIDLASESFGQGFNVTPIQLATAVCTAVNGGYLVQPHVVKQELDAEGNVVKNYDTVEKRQVISKQTSETVCELLESVVNGGSGKNAYVAGYRIGGKTGTSQKLAQESSDPDSKPRVSSFCGFAPVDDPQLVVLVVLDEPHGANIYGGTIAAPVAGKIFADVLPYIGLEAQYTDAELAAISKVVPALTGESVEAAKQKLKGMGLNVKVIGDGDTVERQTPSRGQNITSAGTVILYTGGEQSSMVNVPDFRGKSVSAVNQLASQYNLNVKYSGTAISQSGSMSYSQDIEAGTSVEVGTVITVSFRVENSSD